MRMLVADGRANAYKAVPVEEEGSLGFHAYHMPEMLKQKLDDDVVFTLSSVTAHPGPRPELGDESMLYTAKL